MIGYMVLGFVMGVMATLAAYCLAYAHGARMGDAIERVMRGG